MKGIVDWSRSCHESNSLETAMPLARVISCASAQYKCTREEASVLSERAGSYGETYKELEAAKADRDLKAQRISASLAAHHADWMVSPVTTSWLILSLCSWVDLLYLLGIIFVYIC